MVNRKQQTVRFYTDDLMSSHADEKVNNKFLKWLNEKYGEHALVTATRGDEHEYLGMKFVFKDSKFTVDVMGKVKEILDEFPLKFKDDKLEKIVAPAGNDMFKQGAGKHLEQEQRELFHQVVAQNLFASK